MYRFLIRENCALLLLMVFLPVFGQDICAIVNCIHGECMRVGGEGSFRCDCNNGYTGMFCERPCTWRDSGCVVVTPAPTCNSANCHNGQCSSSEFGYCMCYEGWTGATCEVDVDYCKVEGRESSYFGPCDDGGAFICIDGNNTYACMCVVGYTGKNCESDIDECSTLPNPCSGNGLCVDGHFGRYSCNCDEGFTGEICDANVTACESSPCLNQGKCHVVSGDQFQCECPIGYRGLRCEVEEADSICATTSPCTNGGTCQDDIDGVNFTCLCRDGYSGKFCSTVKCTDNFCRHGGICVQGNLEPRCECNPYYRGRHCEHDVCGNITCLNDGLCAISDADSLPICSCTEGFAGEHCEKQKSNPCSNLTCIIGGACKAINDSISRCTCADEFTGLTCKLQDLCFNLTCLNERICTVVNKSTQLCFVTCSNSTCLNGGTWTAPNNSIPFCSCVEGFMGECCKDHVCTPNPCPDGKMCEYQAGKIHCLTVTTKPTRASKLAYNPVALGILLTLGILLLMCVCLVIFCFNAWHKYHLKRISYTGSNQFVIHAEYHTNSSRHNDCEDNDVLEVVTENKSLCENSSNRSFEMQSIKLSFSDQVPGFEDETFMHENFLDKGIDVEVINENAFTQGSNSVSSDNLCRAYSETPTGSIDPSFVEAASEDYPVCGIAENNYLQGDICLENNEDLGVVYTQ